MLSKLIECVIAVARFSRRNCRRFHSAMRARSVVQLDAHFAHVYDELFRFAVRSSSASIAPV